MSPILIATIILCYFLVLITISFVTGGKGDNDTFFKGNNQSPWYIVSIGMIGASLSGVTFISVPGKVGATGLSYMQMVLGFFVGYIVIARVLLPLYYRLNLTSIYTYLEGRYGFWTYKTGAILFILSRTVGAAARLYLMANVLQITLFDSFNVPFEATVLVTILLIWLYTFKGGIKTIIWTDTLQTLFMLLSVACTIIIVAQKMDLSLIGVVSSIKESDYSTFFVFDHWAARNNFFKYFISGAFITIVMTGLDQDMMQKNLTCKNVSEAKRNMYWYGFAFIPVNLMILVLGALLFIFVQQQGISMPERPDDLFPIIATKGYLPEMVGVFFVLGLVAAAYSSADSALTSLTTSFSVDIMGVGNQSPTRAKQTRFIVHVAFSLLLAGVILLFRMFNNGSIIDAVFNLAGYTYGPLLGLYSFGLFNKRQVNDAWVPLVAFLAPVGIGVIDYNSMNWWGIHFGFEKLIVNGVLSFLGLYLLSLLKAQAKKEESLVESDS